MFDSRPVNGARIIVGIVYVSFNVSAMCAQFIYVLVVFVGSVVRYCVGQGAVAIWTINHRFYYLTP